MMQLPVFPAMYVFILFCLQFVTSGTREGENRPFRRCDVKQTKDEGTRRQPPIPTDQYTGREIFM